MLLSFHSNCAVLCDTKKEGGREGCCSSSVTDFHLMVRDICYKNTSVSTCVRDRTESRMVRCCSDAVRSSQQYVGPINALEAKTLCSCVELHTEQIKETKVKITCMY